MQIKYYKQYFISFILLFNLLSQLLILNKNNKLYKKKIGVISCNHDSNVGNNLVKYSIYIILSNFGFDPYIVGTNNRNYNISFLRKNINVRTVNNFSEVKRKDYDILIVNSDQTRRNWDNDFYDIAFLKFAKDWNIKNLYMLPLMEIYKRR